MRDLGEELSIPMFVYGPETHMTAIGAHILRTTLANSIFTINHITVAMALDKAPTQPVLLDSETDPVAVLLDSSLPQVRVNSFP